MQALAQLPEKLRQRRRVRQRMLDHESPRAAFSNPKYGSTSRNFIFRAMATKRITPTSDSTPYEEMREEEEEGTEEEEPEGESAQPVTSSTLQVSDVTVAICKSRPETACQKIYHRACAKLQVLPSMNVHDHLACSQMLLPHSGVGQDEVKAIAIALVHNCSVHTLNMADNRLGGQGAAFITEALRENRSLVDLNLSNNALRTEGARLLSEALLVNTSIIRVNLSGNNLQDKDLVFVTDMLEKNKTLRDLNLSHNHICHLGGILLGRALEINGTLRTLDVSWNHIRLRGAEAFCRGVGMNRGLTRLRVAWNGLAVEGCCELSRGLGTQGSPLVELDLTANRIHTRACRLLFYSLRSNTTLRCLRIGHNPITSETALSILVLLAEDLTGLKELDLTGVPVDQQFTTLLHKVQQKRPLELTHGVTLRHDDVTCGSRPAVLDSEDPVMILFEFMRQKNLRVIDLLHCFDKTKSDSLTREELRNGLMSMDIPLSNRSMDILMKKLDLNKDGVVDYEELGAGWKEHVRRMAKWKRKAERQTDNSLLSRLQEVREAIRMRIEASQRRGTT